jgi:hypothetical protein
VEKANLSIIAVEVSQAGGRLLLLLNHGRVLFVISFCYTRYSMVWRSGNSTALLPSHGRASAMN